MSAPRGPVPLGYNIAVYREYEDNQVFHSMMFMLLPLTIFQITDAMTASDYPLAIRLCREALTDPTLPRLKRARYYTYLAIIVDKDAEIELANAQAMLDEIKKILAEPEPFVDPRRAAVEANVDRLQDTVDTIRGELVEEDTVQRDEEERLHRTTVQLSKDSETERRAAIALEEDYKANATKARTSA